MSILKDKARALGFRQITGGKSKFIAADKTEMAIEAEPHRRLKSKVVGRDFAMFTGEDYVTMAVRLTKENREAIENFLEKNSTLRGWKTLNNCPYDGGSLFDAEGKELLTEEVLQAMQG